MSRAAVAPALLAAFLLAVPAMAEGPAGKVQEGNRRYLEGDLEGALTQYTEAQVDLPDSPVLHYNIGNVLFRQGDYERATEEYRLAELSDDPELRNRARYNIGNARFLSQDFAGAVEDYVEVLRRSPEDADAKRNLELALQMLQQQPPQEKPAPSDEPQSDEPKDEQQQESPQQQQEGEDSSDQSQGEEEQSEGQPDEPRDPEGGESEQRSGEDPSADAPRPQPQEATLPEQEAARILDSLKQEEKENMKRALRPARTGRGTGKDW